MTWVNHSSKTHYENTLLYKIPESNFCQQNLTPYTPRKKSNLFVSVYWQVSHYQLFRTLKISKTIHWAGWTVLLNLIMKTWFLSKIINYNFCQRNLTPYTLKKNRLLLCRYIHKQLTLNFSEHLKFLRTVQWAQRTVLLEFITKMEKVFFFPEKKTTSK